MARYKLNPTKKENIYWYTDADKKKKYAYRYKYYDHVGVRREKTKQNFDTSLAAERALTAIKATILNGGVKIAQNENTTVSQWVEIYFERKLPRWKGTTPKTYRDAIDMHIEPLLGKYKLSRLTKSIYQAEFIDKLTPIASPTSIKMYHNFFMGCINAAVEDEIIEKNKLSRVELPPIPKKNNDEVEGNYLTESELQYLLKCVKRSCDITRYTLIALLAASGMRRGEASALKWSEINFKNKSISINNTRDSYGERSAKTLNSIRTINMTDDLASVLERYRRWCIERKLAFGIKHNDDDIVFIGRNCNPLNQNAARLTLIQMHEEYDIKLISPHGLRHTFATILINQGTPAVSVAKILGNTTHMVTTTYAHSFAESEMKAMQVFGSIVNFD